MFKISFCPQLSDADVSLEKRGHVLIVNGDELDFGDLPDGGGYPAEALENPSFVGGVERIAGIIRVTVILPYWVPGYFDTPEPITVTSDGPVALPEGRYPPPEDLPLPEPDPVAEGEDNAAQ